MIFPMTKLDEVTDKIGSGVTPRGGDSVYVQDGTSLIRSQNIYNSQFTNDGLVYIDDKTAGKMKGVTVLKDDVLLNITGDSVARCCKVDERYLPARVNQHVAIVRPKKRELDPDFLMFYLTSPYMQAKMLSWAGSGGTRKALTKGMIQGFEVPTPHIDIQLQISSFLRNYNDLIENNKRRIELLEESARQLYKEWFVRFRFPSYEHIKVVDGVPEGWELKPLVEIAELTMGQSPKSEYYNTVGDGLPFHQGVTNYGARFVEHHTWCTQLTRTAEVGDILFSVRAPVGRINITLDKIILGRGLAAIKAKRSAQSFLFYQLKSVFFKEDMIGGGAIYAAITKKDLQNYELLVPSSALIEQFELFASDIDWQIETIYHSNRKLMEARDLLLPKLMSGEIAA